MAVMTTGVADPLQRRRWLTNQTDWIASTSRATELGRRARRAYLDRSQIRNLQRVAETSAAVSTLTDYIKTQTGKHPLWRRENFGPMLLDDLERLQSRLGDNGPGDGGSYADLCRLFIRQVAASYVYSIAVDATAPRPAAPPARSATATRTAGTARPPRQRSPRGVAPPADQGVAPETSGSAESTELALSGGDEPDVTATDAERATEEASGTAAAEVAAAALTDVESPETPDHGESPRPDRESESGVTMPEEGR